MRTEVIETQQAIEPLTSRLVVPVVKRKANANMKPIRAKPSATEGVVVPFVTDDALTKTKKIRKTKSGTKTSEPVSSDSEGGVLSIRESQLLVDPTLTPNSKIRKTVNKMESATRLSSETEGGVHQDRDNLLVADSALDQTISKLVYLWRQRQRWHRAEKSLILQGKALCRALSNGDKKEGTALFDKAEAGEDVGIATMAALAPFLASIKHFEAPRKDLEKQICKLTKELPAYEWIESIKGVGALSYGGLIGEAGNLTRYPGVSHLWKRMGVAVIGDKRQRRVADKEEALIHGYSPSRRSHLWNIGNGLIGGMGHGPRPIVNEDISLREEWTEYQKMFVARCRYECETHPDMFTLVTVEKNGEALESYPKHAQARAKRYVEKEFLRDLRAQWRKEVLGIRDE